MKIFISSTVKDLSNERKILSNALTKFAQASGIEVVSQRFEDWVEATEQGHDAMVVCFERLKSCDYCIVMLGGFYGSRPSGGYNPENLSATELEFNLALEISHCKVIALERRSRLLENKSTLLKNQLERDKNDYTRFRNKISEKAFIAPFYKKDDIPILALSAIVGDFYLKLSLKTEIADIYSAQLSFLNKRLPDVINRVRELSTESDSRALNLIKELYEMSRAMELAQSLKIDHGVKVMSIRLARRAGHVADAKEMADELINQLWSENLSRNISTIPKMSKDDSNVLCQAILERGLLSRYELDFEGSLDYHKVCLNMCETSDISIYEIVKQRVFEVVSSTYFYIGDVSNARSIVERAEDMLCICPESERGAESRLSLLKAIIKVASRDGSAIEELREAGTMYSNENNLLGVVICDLWQVIYYNSIGDNVNSKKILDDLNKKGLRFMKEKDLICRYIWSGAEGGKNYMELFSKPKGI